MFLKIIITVEYIARSLLKIVISIYNCKFETKSCKKGVCFFMQFLRIQLEKNNGIFHHSINKENLTKNANGLIYCLR